MTKASYTVSKDTAKQGKNGERHLIAGEGSAMRMWDAEQPADSADKPVTRNAYETLGYVVAGQVELSVDGQTITLKAGDSYRVPRDTEHTYRVLEQLTAIEVTTPAADK